jgi:Phosphotransferase enzyme family
VHGVLAHLAENGFAGSPRPLGLDEQGREVLTFLPGETAGNLWPWPGWVYAENTLVQVARWVCGFHRAVADFIPPPGAAWRMGGQWAPGLIVGHNDAAPYNAVWRDGRLARFIDWEMAGPVTAAWDVAFAAFSWVPLHARHVVAREGFTDFEGRPPATAVPGRVRLDCLSAGLSRGSGCPDPGARHDPARAGCP